MKKRQKFDITLFNNTSDEYELLNEPHLYKDHAQLKHKSCGHIFYMRCDAFLTMNHRCPRCYGKISPTPDEYRSSLPDGFITNDDYSDRDKNMTYVHTVCGRSFVMTPHNFKRVRYCPHCNREQNTYKRVQKFTEILNAVDPDYVLLGTYTRSIIPTKFKHLTCGCEFETTPNKFLAGVRCPSCRYKESKAEQQISQMLKENNIIYSRQYRFSECKAIRSLPFDFAIFDSDRTLICLIEFDGAQHFNPMGFINGVKKFETTKAHDSIKTEFCQANNIALYRISYQDDINEKINKILGTIHYNIKNEGGERCQNN